jgi:hypothetical protein
MEEFQGDRLFSLAYVSQLKSRGPFERVPLTEKSVQFTLYVKKKFPYFNASEFIIQGGNTYPQEKLNILHSAGFSEDIPIPKPVNKENNHIYNSKSINLRSTYRHIFRFIYSLIIILFIIVPYYVLFLLVVKDYPSELFTFSKELEADLDPAKTRPYVYGNDYMDLYKHGEGVYSKDTSVIAQNGSYLSTDNKALERTNYPVNNNKHIFNKSS